MAERCLAVIPARDGSKGVPGKNLRRVGGVPLVVRTVRAALASSVDRVVVSTDSAEIAAVTAEAEAEVVTRPAELSGDRASSESALLHVLEALADAEDYVPDVLALLQCTSPFTVPDDIDGTLRALADSGADAALTVARSHRFLWRRGPGGAGTAVNHDPGERLPRQELAPEFVETGAVYAIDVQRFLATGRRFPGRVALHEVPAARSLEIDDSADLDVARHLAASMPLPDGSTAGLPASPAAVVLDFDGVLTDDRVLTLQDGTEGVLCSRGDGLGVEHLRHAGVRMLVLSKECNPVVAARAAKLRLECLQGDDDKAATVVRWCRAGRIDLSRVVYVGNDVNDLGAFRVVGFPVAVADAHPSVRAAARLVLDAPGGRGAARELSERILDQERTPS